MLLLLLLGVSYGIGVRLGLGLAVWHLSTPPCGLSPHDTSSFGASPQGMLSLAGWPGFLQVAAQSSEGVGGAKLS